MEINIKGNLNHKQKSQAEYLVTTINHLLRRSIKELRPPVFSFKWTQVAAHHNINILAAFNGHLVNTIIPQKLIPLDYVSEFLDLTCITKLFSRHEVKNIKL